MTTTLTKGTQKRTFSIKNDFAEKLNKYKNKSKVINNALKLYFEREKYLKKAEKEFFKNFEIEEFFKEEKVLEKDVNFEIVTDKDVVETINKVNGTKSTFLTFG